MKIKTKFTFFTFFLLSLITVAISFSLFITQKNLTRDELEINRKKIFREFTFICRDAAISKDDISVLNTIKTLVQTHKPAIVYAGYLSPTETILLTTRDKGQQDSFNKRLSKVLGFTISNFTTPKNEDVLEMAEPLTVNGVYGGILKVGFSQDYLATEVQRSVGAITKIIAQVSLISLVIGLLLSLWISEHLNRPIKELNEAALKISEGDLSVRVSIERKDELGNLANTFNAMVLRIKEIDELKDTFVSSVSHELRSPLSAIDGYCDYLIEGLERSMSVEKQLKALEIIKESTIRLTNFINNILDLAKIRSNKMEMRKAPIALYPLVEEIFSLFSPIAARDSKQFFIELPEDFPLLEIDPEKIKQVVTNLLSNALKFTGPGSKITVGGRKLNQNFAEVTVSDTGTGMPPESVDKIFDKFYQISDGVNKKPKGTGLGLAIVSEIIRLHGGDIKAESELSQGSTFRFTLPIFKK